MEQDQINYQSEMNNKEQKRIELLSEKYGYENNRLCIIILCTSDFYAYIWFCKRI